MRVEVGGKSIQVSSLKFRDFVRLMDLIQRLVQDAEKGQLRLGKYLEEALPLVEAMTGLPEDEIKELPASEGLKLLRSCIEKVLEDKDFLRELNQLTEKLKQFLSPKR